jgi:hypothetical protein
MGIKYEAFFNDFVLLLFNKCVQKAPLERAVPATILFRYVAIFAPNIIQISPKKHQNYAFSSPLYSTAEIGPNKELALQCTKDFFGPGIRICHILSHI